MAADDDLPAPDDSDVPVDEPTKPAADESENPEAVVPPGYEGGSDGSS
jgi:hypothetical protein